MKKILYLSFTLLCSQSIYTQQENILENSNVVADQQVIDTTNFDASVAAFEKLSPEDFKPLFINQFSIIEEAFKSNADVKLDPVKYDQFKLIIDLMSLDTFKTFMLNTIKSTGSFGTLMSKNNDVVTEEMKAEATENYIEAAKVNDELYEFLKENKDFAQTIACVKFTIQSAPKVAIDYDKAFVAGQKIITDMPAENYKNMSLSTLPLAKAVLQGLPSYDEAKFEKYQSIFSSMPAESIKTFGLAVLIVIKPILPQMMSGSKIVISDELKAQIKADYLVAAKTASEDLYVFLNENPIYLELLFGK